MRKFTRSGWLMAYAIAAYTDELAEVRSWEECLDDALTSAGEEEFWRGRFAFRWMAPEAAYNRDAWQRAEADGFDGIHFPPAEEPTLTGTPVAPTAKSGEFPPIDGWPRPSADREPRNEYEAQRALLFEDSVRNSRQLFRENWEFNPGQLCGSPGCELCNHIIRRA